MAERRMASLAYLSALESWRTSSGGTFGNYLINHASITIQTIRFYKTTAESVNWMDTVYPMPRWVDYGLPWQWRIYGTTTNEGTGPNKYVFGVSLGVTRIGATNDPALGVFGKKTLQIVSGGTWILQGADNVESSPYVDGKLTTVANSPQDGDLLYVRLQRFTSDPNDTASDGQGFMFQGLELWAPVRDQANLEGWVSL